MQSLRVCQVHEVTMAERIIDQMPAHLQGIYTQQSNGGQRY